MAGMSKNDTPKSWPTWFWPYFGTNSIAKALAIGFESDHSDMPKTCGNDHTPSNSLYLDSSHKSFLRVARAAGSDCNRISGL